ncbi:MAG: hypothetical protein GC190_04970 [Alphaproteobacteria bacterium]|nr:hypothetical protein [Alphaproteobacteria bacterium]
MKAKRRGALHRSFVVALLLAFVFQAQLAASHIHFLNIGSGVALADSGNNSSPNGHKQLPAGDDCPICQQLASAHSFLAQAIISLSLPSLVGTHTFDVFDERAPVPLIALSWQSRAPPL